MACLPAGKRRGGQGQGMDCLRLAFGGGEAAEATVTGKVSVRGDTDTAMDIDFGGVWIWLLEGAYVSGSFGLRPSS